MQNVKVVSIEDAGYYTSNITSGSCVKVTLQRDNDFATCDGILIWDEEYLCDDLFDEWVDCAKNNEEGYTAFIVEGNETAMYGG
jgi:hypothetical protein